MKLTWTPSVTSYTISSNLNVVTLIQTVSSVWLLAFIGRTMNYKQSQHQASRADHFLKAWSDMRTFSVCIVDNETQTLHLFHVFFLCVLQTPFRPTMQLKMFHSSTIRRVLLSSNEGASSLFGRSLGGVNEPSGGIRSMKEIELCQNLNNTLACWAVWLRRSSTRQFITGLQRE